MDKQKDLFGNEYDLDVIIQTEPGSRIKSKIRYRKSDNKKECCKTCIFSFYKQYSKRYYKCEKIGNTGGLATDIRISSVCDLWKSIYKI